MPLQEGSGGNKADLLQLARDSVPGPSGSTFWHEAHQPCSQHTTALAWQRLLPGEYLPRLQLLANARMPALLLPITV